MFAEDSKSPYVEWEFYNEKYGGTKVLQTDFTVIEREVEAYFAQITFGRVARMETVPERVKMAICAACDAYADFVKEDERKVRSESNDGYSVTYADAETETACRAKMGSKMRMYLAGTGLTYRGWSEEHDKQR